MTDPLNALVCFQREFKLGRIRVRQCELDRSLYVYDDVAEGTPRSTYVTLEGKAVTALVILGLWEPIDETPCFCIGYAVPEKYRNQGRATKAVSAAIAELKHAQPVNSPFYVEAIVGADNKPSQRVAEQIISDKPIAMTDEISGLPAFRYVRKIE
jgi:Acetyltransferase (GNAT) domain